MGFIISGNELFLIYNNSSISVVYLFDVSGPSNEGKALHTKLGTQPNFIHVALLHADRKSAYTTSEYVHKVYKIPCKQRTS